MAEPLGITGLVLQVADTLKRLYDYVQEVKGAKKEICDLYAELVALKGVLEQLGAARDLNSSSKSFLDALVTAKILVDSILDELGSRKWSKLDALTWPHHKKGVEDQTKRAERLKAYFILALMTDASSSQSEMAYALDDIVKGLESDRRIRQQKIEDKHHEAMKAWISPISPLSTHSKACAARLPDTGEWFTEQVLRPWFNHDTKTFLSWCERQREQARKLKNAPRDEFDGQKNHPMEGDPRLLYVTGTSGSGKTILCSTAIEALIRWSESNDQIMVAYFYFSFDNKPSRLISSLLGSLVAQLSDRHRNVLDNFQSDFTKGAMPNEKALTEAISKCLTSFEHVYLCVDAINESTRESAVMHALYRLMSQAKNLSVMVTSVSPAVSLSPYLKSVKANVYLSPENTIDDMLSYVTTHLEDEGPASQLGEESKGRLKEQLIRNADGMFRYIECQLAYLSRLRTGRDVKRALDKMPEDLNQIYTTILGRIPAEDQDRVKEALVWLLYAEQPLSLAALCEAVVLEMEDTDLDFEMRIQDPATLLEMCQGLIVYDSETKQASLAHSSIRTFLTAPFLVRGRGRNDPSPATTSATMPYYHVEPGEAKRHILKKCLAYLMFEPFQQPCRDEDSLSQRLQEYPLLKYASQCWPAHFLAAPDLKNPVDSHPQMVGLAMDFLSTYKPSSEKEAAAIRPAIGKLTGNYTSWIQVLLSSNTTSSLVPTSPTPATVDPTLLDTHPLYYTASFGLLSLTKLLVGKSPEQNIINRPGGRVKATPLQAAVFRGHSQVVSYLLEECHADPNIANEQGLTNIECVRLRSGPQFEMIEALLIEAGAKEPVVLVYPRAGDEDEKGAGSSNSGHSGGSGGSWGFDSWSRCCQCGGEFAWGSAVFGKCGDCMHPKCEGCKGVSRRR